MTTVINTPQPSDDTGGGLGMIVGLVLVILIGYLVFAYGLPALRQVQTGPQINVPDQIDVNINQPN